jgi:GNAT superfamily N-acetyltransferase
VLAYVTGLPIALFNGCVVVEPAAPSALDEALRWVAGAGVPLRLFVAHEHEPELAEVTVERRLERSPVPYPGMVLHPIADPDAPPANVVVESADATGADEFRSVAIASGFSREVAEALYSESFLADADVQAFVGRLDGRPVGYSLAILSERTGGVYNVGTVPDARRKGVGTALTWAAVDVARQAGFDCAVLQASEMGLPIYEAMGFRNVVLYAVFGEAVSPTGQDTPVPPSPQ